MPARDVASPRPGLGIKTGESDRQPYRVRFSEFDGIGE